MNRSAIGSEGPEIDRREPVTGNDARGASKPLRRRLPLFLLVASVSLGIAGFASLELVRASKAPGGIRSGFDVGVFSARPERKNQPAPEIAGAGLNDKQLSLSQFRGKVVLLNYWGSWCASCRREQPDLERVWREYQDRGVQFLGVDSVDGRSDGLTYVKEFGVTYPSILDPSAKLAYRLNVAVLPTTFVIDPQGIIVYRLVGTTDAALLRTVLDGAGAHGGTP